jgi:outer membrane protein
MGVNLKFFSMTTVVLLICFCCSGWCATVPPAQQFNVATAIARALDVSLGIQSARDGIVAAGAAKKSAATQFLPTFNARYQFTRNQEEDRVPILGVVTPKTYYSLVGTVTQPLFSGFSILNRYKMSELGLDFAQAYEKRFSRRVVFETKNAYFSFLKAVKMEQVSTEAVTMLEAHRDMIQNYYQEGMNPYNDILKVDVELANTRQELIVAGNARSEAQSVFNILLRRPVDEPVDLEDVSGYEHEDRTFSHCLERAMQNRLDLEIADLEVLMAEKELDLAKKDRYPMVNLQTRYYKRGSDWDLDGGQEINDPDSWDLSATASWNFWEWGRTGFGVGEKKSQLSQARHNREAVGDRVTLDVKHAFLKTIEFEKNIVAVEKAVTQAEENYRIVKERFGQQMATSTDILDARVLLSRTMTNYYNALYDYKIATAALERAMGEDVIP